MHLLNDDPQWSEQFAHERRRLLATLGPMVEGGIVATLGHIGATRVPGGLARSCVDIGLAIWPFPLEAQWLISLEACGYMAVPGYEGAPEQRLDHVTGMFQLHIVEAGSERWTDFLIIRDYLRQDGAARRSYYRRKRALAESADGDLDKYEAGIARLFGDLLPAARLWRIDSSGFASVQVVVQELVGLQWPWYISSGWALDLFLGRATRVHHDVDVVVAQSDQLVLQEYLTVRGWTFLMPLDGRLEPWPLHLQLELPHHQVHAHRAGQFIDCLIMDIAGGVWRYRRNPHIIRTVERMALQTLEGIPFIAPELVLLYKSTATNDKARSKDQADFEKVSTELEPERRAWLRWALTVDDANHPWLSALG